MSPSYLDLKPYLIKNIPCNDILEFWIQPYLNVQHTATHSLCSEVQRITTTSTTNGLLKVALIKKEKQFWKGNPLLDC